MAGTGVSLYATTAAGNKTVIGTIDWREDVYMPSQINDNVAQIMADIRAMANAVATGWIEIGDGEGTYTATYVSATSFRFDGVDVTAYYRAGMRVRVVAPTPGTLSGTITSSTFSTHTTLVVAWDSGSLSNEAITSVSLGVGSGDTTDPAVAISKSYRNILGRNGGFEVWQRGAGEAASIAVAASSTSGVYTADGWAVFTGAGQASVVSQQPGLTNGSRWCARVQRNSGQTGVVAMVYEFPLDTDEIARARGQVVTLSLTLRAGANWSPASGTMALLLFTGTGSPAKRNLGVYTGDAQAINVTQAITTTATRYSFTSGSALGAAVSQGSVLLSWVPVGTAGAADYFEIDDVQLEIGSVATPFERPPFERELSACQRHYRKSYNYPSAPAAVTGNGEIRYLTAGTGGEAAPTVAYQVRMRVTPTLTFFCPVTGAGNARRNYSTGVTDSMNAVQAAGEIGHSGGNAHTAAQVYAYHYMADAGI